MCSDATDFLGEESGGRLPSTTSAERWRCFDGGCRRRREVVEGEQPEQLLHDVVGHHDGGGGQRRHGARRGGGRGRRSTGSKLGRRHLERQHKHSGVRAGGRSSSLRCPCLIYPLTPLLSAFYHIAFGIGKWRLTHIWLWNGH